MKHEFSVGHKWIGKRPSSWVAGTAPRLVKIGWIVPGEANSQRILRAVDDAGAYLASAWTTLSRIPELLQSQAMVRTLLAGYFDQYTEALDVLDWTESIFARWLQEELYGSFLDTAKNARAFARASAPHCLNASGGVVTPRAALVHAWLDSEGVARDQIELEMASDEKFTNWFPRGTEYEDLMPQARVLREEPPDF